MHTKLLHNEKNDKYNNKNIKNAKYKTYEKNLLCNLKFLKCDIT